MFFVVSMSDEVCKARRRSIADVQNQARAGRYVIALLSVEKNTEECILVPEDCLPGGPKENEFLARCPHCGIELAAFQNVFMHFAGLEKTRKQKPGKKSKIKSVQQWDLSTSSFIDKPNPWRATPKDSSIIREPRPSTGSLPLPTFPGSHEPLRSLSEQPSTSSLFRFPSAVSTPHQWMSQVPISSVASSTSMLSHPDSAMINAHMKSAAAFPWQQSGAQPWPGQPHNPHLWAAAAWLQQPWLPQQTQWLLPKDDPKNQIPFGIHPWMPGSSSSAEQNIFAQHAAAAAQWRYDQPLSHRHIGTPPAATGEKWPQDLQPPKKQQCLNDRASSSSSHNMWTNNDPRSDISSRHSLGQEPRATISSSNGRQSHSSMGSSGWGPAQSSTNTPAAPVAPTYNWSSDSLAQQNDCMHDERRHRKSHHHEQQAPPGTTRKEPKDAQPSQQQTGASGSSYREDMASAAAYNNTLDRPPPWGGLAPQDIARPNYMFDLRPPLMQDGWSSMRPAGMPVWPITPCQSLQPHNPGFNRFLDQVYLDGFHKNDAYNVSF